MYTGESWGVCQHSGDQTYGQTDPFLRGWAGPGSAQACMQWRTQEMQPLCMLCSKETFQELQCIFCHPCVAWTWEGPFVPPCDKTVKKRQTRVCASFQDLQINSSFLGKNWIKIYAIFFSNLEMVTWFSLMQHQRRHFVFGQSLFCFHRDNQVSRGVAICGHIHRDGWHSVHKVISANTEQQEENVAHESKKISRSCVRYSGPLGGTGRALSHHIIGHRECHSSP